MCHQKVRELVGVVNLGTNPALVHVAARRLTSP